MCVCVSLMQNSTTVYIFVNTYHVIKTGPKNLFYQKQVKKICHCTKNISVCFQLKYRCHADSFSLGFFKKINLHMQTKLTWSETQSWFLYLACFFLSFSCDRESDSHAGDPMQERRMQNSECLFIWVCLFVCLFVDNFCCGPK